MRTTFNRLIVFILTGLWHGANFTFLIWGLIHYLFLTAEDFGKKNFKKIPKGIIHIYTIIIVVVSFAVFRAENINYAADYVTSMFFSITMPNLSTVFKFCNPYNITVFFFGVVFASGILGREEKNKKKSFSILEYIISVILFGMCLINISAASYNPFIYFRF